MNADTADDGQSVVLPGWRVDFVKREHTIYGGFSTAASAGEAIQQVEARFFTVEGIKIDAERIRYVTATPVRFTGPGNIVGDVAIELGATSGAEKETK
jgi:hypothetical protein